MGVANRLTGLLAGLLVVAAVQAQPEPLTDPLPDVPAGDIRIVAMPFLQLPRSRDAVAGGNTNDAWARLQSLQAVPDGSGRLMVSDLRGLLYVSDEQGRAAEVYLDLREQPVGFDTSAVPNEMGLLGFAFHPQFADPGSSGYGKFYTAFSASVDSGVADYLEAPDNTHESVVMEWTTANPAANRFQGSHRQVFRIGQFAGNHNIGTLAFNPAAAPGEPDFGMLYFSLGDGGGANDPRENGQSLATPMSSIVRIDPLGGSGGRGYGIPADNPFVGRDAVAPEIWAWGIRHAQHFSFDTDGTLYFSDIGQSWIEEVNIGVAGANYGWRLREGTFASGFAVDGGRPNRVYALPADDQGFTYPVAQYDHDPSNAISSGYVYRGSAIPELVDKFVFTDMVTGRVYYFDVADIEPGRQAAVQELRISIDGQQTDLAEAIGFANTYYSGKRADIRLGVDSRGELYLLSKGDGRVRRLIAAQ